MKTPIMGDAEEDLCLPIMKPSITDGWTVGPPVNITHRHQTPKKSARRRSKRVGSEESCRRRTATDARFRGRINSLRIATVLISLLSLLEVFWFPDKHFIRLTMQRNIEEELEIVETYTRLWRHSGIVLTLVSLLLLLACVKESRVLIVPWLANTLFFLVVWTWAYVERVSNPHLSEDGQLEQYYIEFVALLIPKTVMMMVVLLYLQTLSEEARLKDCTVPNTQDVDVEWKQQSRTHHRVKYCPSFCGG